MFTKKFLRELHMLAFHKKSLINRSIKFINGMQVQYSIIHDKFTFLKIEKTNQKLFKQNYLDMWLVYVWYIFDFVY